VHCAVGIVRCQRQRVSAGTKVAQERKHHGDHVADGAGAEVDPLEFGIGAINLEADLIAKYVEKMMKGETSSTITMENLVRQGF